ncbi:MAG TPA: PD-(D/E)XK nuclease-like domain-containing protein [Enhygromyxa sp.]|nr:PD-(D/E)XK nuclease-like domain-containing protein [Enhygromyxa sp.]
MDDTIVRVNVQLDFVRALKPGEAVLVDWTAERYHADTETISRSQLEDLRASPQLFYQRHVERSLPSEPPSPAMQLGTYVHLAVLEPEEWRRRLYQPKPVRPANADGRRKAGTPERDAYEAWVDDLEDWHATRPADAIELDQDGIAKVEAMARAVREHPFASMILADEGGNEQTVLWRPAIEPMAQLLEQADLDPCLAESMPVIRLRVDGLRRIDETTLAVLDLKTTQDPCPGSFGASIARYGYHRQGAIYIDGVQALFPGQWLHFFFCAVRSRPPYEAACYEIDPNDLALGRAQYMATLRDYLRRQAEGDWLAEWQRTCKGINMPGWAHHQES